MINRLPPVGAEDGQVSRCCWLPAGLLRAKPDATLGFHTQSETRQTDTVDCSRPKSCLMGVVSLSLNKITAVLKSFLTSSD